MGVIDVSFYTIWREDSITSKKVHIKNRSFYLQLPTDENRNSCAKYHRCADTL